MATTKIWAIRNSLSDSVEYVKNPLKCALEYISSEGKTLTRELQTGINCDVDNCLDEMQDVKYQFGKQGGIVAHHAEQSFMPGEITPLKAHEIGVKFAEKMWGDRFQVIICTHTDKEHIHNHFLINSVSYIDGKKYDGCKATYRKIREYSDQLCRDNELSIVTSPKGRGVSIGAIYVEKREKLSNRKLLMSDIDHTISISSSMNEFYGNLEKLGYDIKFGKHIAVRMAGRDRYMRLKSLQNDDYLPDGIRRRIAENYTKKYGVVIMGNYRKVPCKKTGYKMTGYKAIYVKYLFALGKIPQRKKTNPSYYTARQLRKLDQISRQTRLIFFNGIENEDDLEKHIGSLNEKYKSLDILRAEKRKEVRRAMPEDERDKIKKEITEITKEMGITRKDLSTCRNIKSNKKVGQTIRKGDREVKDNEYGSRNRGNDR